MVQDLYNEEKRFKNIKTSYDYKIDISNTSEILIGNNPRHNINVNIKDCAFAEVKLTKRGNQFEVSKAAEIDCYVNGALFVGTETVAAGFFLTFGKFNFYVTEKAIFTSVSKDITTKLPHYDLTNDSCGIKQGFNSETIVLNSKDGNEQGNGYCCGYF